MSILLWVAIYLAIGWLLCKWHDHAVNKLPDGIIKETTRLPFLNRLGIVLLWPMLVILSIIEFLDSNAR